MNKIKKKSKKNKKNPVAKILRTTKYKPQIKYSGKVYTRKKNHKKISLIE